MSTLRTINVIHPSGSTTNVVNDSSGNITVGGGITSASALDMGSSFKRNRILNGNMLIDQRNAGAQISAANLTNGTYMVDRWAYFSTQSAKFTAQQNAGAVTTEVGFPNYLGMTVATAVSVGASDTFGIYQYVEGFNFADLAWGTASAKTVTLSFRVYSSLTGTFGGALRNSAATRSYPFTYTISSANTWTTISVTVAGDTSGTWVGATNGIGVAVLFSLGTGSTSSTTAGAWAAGSYVSATGAVSVVGTNGATFYVTGVQLEVGTKATPYEMQIYSDQLAQCQRYYTTVNASLGGVALSFIGNQYNGAFNVTMRSTPTITVLSSTNINTTGATITAVNPTYYQHYSLGSSSGGFISGAIATASAEL